MSDDPRVIIRQARPTKRIRFGRLTEIHYDPLTDDGELKYWLAHEVRDAETDELLGVEEPDDELRMVRVGIRANLGRVVQTDLGPVSGAHVALYLKGLLPELIAERVAELEAQAAAVAASGDAM